MTFTILVVLIIFAVFAIGIIFVARDQLGAGKNRQHSQKLLNNLAPLGFVPLTTPPPDLLRSVETLHRSRPAQEFLVNNLMLRRLPDVELYSFDLLDSSGDDNASTSAGELLFTSRYLRLPRMTIFPNFPNNGPLAQLLQQVYQKALDFVAGQRNWEHLMLPLPGSDRECMVLAPESLSARQFLTAQRLSDLGRAPQVFLEAGEGALALVRLPGLGRKNDSASEAAWVDSAMQLYKSFLD